MDMERNTNGCGPSYQPADGGGWIVAASTHKTNISENYIGEKGAKKGESLVFCNKGVPSRTNSFTVRYISKKYALKRDKYILAMVKSLLP